jgi:XAP5, circadian clock regulator
MGPHRCLYAQAPTRGCRKIREFVLFSCIVVHRGPSPINALIVAIMVQARGKSGPLFHFDVHEDIRVQNDASREKDESHAGKVVERHWYNRNKHIFPASRWELLDLNKSYDKYTIHGSEVN